jgi:hypothetical protein
MMMLPCLAESGTRAILAECWSFGAYRVDALSQARDLHSTMVSDRFAKIAGGYGVIEKRGEIGHAKGPAGNPALRPSSGRDVPGSGF